MDSKIIWQSKYLILLVKSSLVYSSIFLQRVQKLVDAVSKTSVFHHGDDSLGNTQLIT